MDGMLPRETIDTTEHWGFMTLRAVSRNSASCMVHNHPSGDPTPSQADIEITQHVAEAAGKLGITVHDHVVIAKSGHASFRELGLL